MDSIVSDELSQAADCGVLARKSLLRLKQLGRILGRFNPYSFPKIFLNLIRSHLEVSIRVCSPVLEGIKI